MNMRIAARGFTLVEVGIAMALTMMLAMALLWPQIVKFREDKAAAQGRQLATLSNAVATYMTVNYAKLAQGGAVDPVKFPTPTEPTVAQLRDAGLLPANFNAVNLYGGGYAVKISQVPAGCTPPDCDLASITRLTNPLTNALTGQLDGPALGSALATLGADGGFSTAAAPGSIVGQGGAWSVANPAGNVAGILGMRAGYGSSGMAQFMRRDGALPATGTQNMGGQDVANVKTLGSTTIQNSGDVAVGGALGVTGQTSTNGIANAGALTTGNATVNGSATITGDTVLKGTLGVTKATTLNGTLAVTGATTTNGLSNVGRLNNTGDVQTGRLFLSTIVANGASCAGFVGYQASTEAGSIASCINGIWRTPAADIPPPAPCPSTTVSFQGCTGVVPYTLSGSTASVTMTAGQGYATYSCNNGSWGFLSGSCTPPPAACSRQSISWNGSASCTGTSAALGHGGSQWVNASGTNDGKVYVTCNNGNLIQSSPSCSPAYVYYSNPKSAEGITLSSNPDLRATWCASHGNRLPAPGYMQDNRVGENLPVCWTINGQNKCIGQGNCNGFSAAEGCWIQTLIVCQ